MNENRHPPLSTFERYARDGLAGSFTVGATNDTPEVRLQIAPVDRRISMLVLAANNVPGPDLRGKANIDYRLEDHLGTMWHRLDVTYDDNLAEIHPILCSIADRIQLEREDFTHAVDAALAGVEQILAGRKGLSRKKRVGLFGELTVLCSLAAATNAAVAFKAWRGPDNEEHDFGLEETDLEVKTTTTEDRAHWITNLKQLVRSTRRPLHLLSIQITAAGAENGRTLPEMVGLAREIVGTPVAELNKSLEDYGYYDIHADLYTEDWRLRSTPAFYLVDDQFPALTTERLFSAVPDAGRVVDLRYRVNVDGLTPEAPIFHIEIPGIPT
jgi:hypothetical protein